MNSPYPAFSFVPATPQPLPFSTGLADARRLRTPDAAASEAAAYRHLQALLEQVPVAMYLLRGPAYILDLVSPAAAASWGRSADQVLGKPFFEALPNLRGQGYEAAYTSVWQTQQVITWREVPVTVVREAAGQAALGYFNVSFQPFHNSQGRMRGILVTSYEVTEQVLACQRVHQAAEELAATNAGLADYVTELTQAAHAAQRHAESQAIGLTRMLAQAPVAIGLFVGADYVVEICNSSLQALWGCTLAQVLHQPLFEALPEIQGQGFREFLDEVGGTGTSSVAHQLPGQGHLNAAPITCLYYPIHDAQGRTTAIAAVATTTVAHALACQPQQLPQQTLSVEAAI